MKIEYYDDPWNHYQVKDFLTEEEFNRFGLQKDSIPLAKKI